MGKLYLAAFALLLAAPFASVASGHNHLVSTQLQPSKNRSHAPEMTEVAMTIAGLSSLGAYLVIRRRYTRQK